jgi:hypothetical protein
MIKSEGEIPVADRIYLPQIKDKLETVYDDLKKLDGDQLLVLCAYVITVHNHWNWESLLTELTQINKS